VQTLTVTPVNLGESAGFSASNTAFCLQEFEVSVHFIICATYPMHELHHTHFARCR
jgi:hypothetical protein